MIFFVTFFNICFSFTKERPWSSKDRIGLSEEGEKKKKFSSETHYWWAKWVRGQNQPFREVVCTQLYTTADEDHCILQQLYWHRHEMCQKFDFQYNFFYTKIHASGLSQKTCKCIDIKHFCHFWIGPNWIVKFQQFQNKITLVCVNFVLLSVVFLKNLHSWHKFYMTAGRGSRDKLQLCIDLNCYVHLEVLIDT